MSRIAVFGRSSRHKNALNQRLRFSIPDPHPLSDSIGTWRDSDFSEPFLVQCIFGRTKSMRTPNLFISHSWAYSDSYGKLVGLLDARPYFAYRNYSVPRDDPIHNARSVATLKAAILRKMAPLQAHGHKVQLIPPQYVRPFVKTNKNDAADAEAICEAVTRPTMRFAPAKSAEQQSVLMLHRARELLVRQRTMVINALRGHCAEFGLIVAQGASKVEELVAIIEDPGDVRLPPLAREALGSLVEQLRSAQARIKLLEVTLLAWHRSNEASRRLATIPGVGVITATALVATIGDGAQFRSGRQLSAWLGLVPRQHSSGGKDRLGRISKRGDGYIRRLLVHGARTVLRWRRAKPGTGPGWTDRLLARRPTNVVLVAMANKTARVAWALLRYERIYRPTPA